MVVLRGLPECTGAPISINTCSLKAEFKVFLTRMLGVYTVPRVLSLFLRSIMVDTTALTQVRVQNIYRTNYRNKTGKQYKSGDSLYRAEVGWDWGKLQIIT